MDYRALVEVKGIGELWVVDCIEGDNIQDFITNVYRYMNEIGVLDFEVHSVCRVVFHGMFFNDIKLN
jgi:hypothetical protein